MRNKERYLKNCYWAKLKNKIVTLAAAITYYSCYLIITDLCFSLLFYQNYQIVRSTLSLENKPNLPKECEITCSIFELNHLTISYIVFFPSELLFSPYKLKVMNNLMQLRSSTAGQMLL